jgi:hypothetical protein
MAALRQDSAIAARALEFAILTAMAPLEFSRCGVSGRSRTKAHEI